MSIQKIKKNMSMEVRQFYTNCVLLQSKILKENMSLDGLNLENIKF